MDNLWIVLVSSLLIYIVLILWKIKNLSFFIFKHGNKMEKTKITYQGYVETVEMDVESLFICVN